MRFPTMWFVRQQRLRPACAYAQTDQSLCLSLNYSMSVKLLIELNLEFLSLTGGCTGSSESILVKMAYCWKSHAAAQLLKKQQHTRKMHAKFPSMQRVKTRLPVFI